MVKAQIQMVHGSKEWEQAVHFHKHKVEFTKQSMEHTLQFIIKEIECVIWIMDILFT